tara:strand:+ start:81 stop:437 length:357 start_codon:yes stop_codon:yes gene_type:complete
MRVIIESPYAGDLVNNVSYARGCLWDSLSRQESPFASHLLYTQVLNDKIPEQREMGLRLALSWYNTADLCAVYTDLGISSGMEHGIAYAYSIGLTVEKRSIKDASQTSFGPSFSFTKW